MRLQGNVLAAAWERKKPEACTYIYMYVIYKYKAHIYEYVYVCIGNSMITLCDKSSKTLITITMFTIMTIIIITDVL